MNWDQIEGNWKQVKGKIQQAYGDLTDDELDKARGDREELVGLLQSKYGKAREEAERECDEFIRKL
ncbi:CsbD family protein [Roseobacteraceae bacterium NS-SX3]